MASLPSSTVGAQVPFRTGRKIKRVTLKLNDRFRIDFNPLVTLASAGLIWGFIICCFILPQQVSVKINPLNTWIARTFSWLYILAENIWVIFLLVIFWKFGNFKLGKEDEKPEYSNMSYFAMLFAAGVGIGLYYYGVSEVMSYYAPTGHDKNRFWHRRTDNERAQDAITQVLLHWGLHAWCSYVVVALSISVVSHRLNLPITIRSSLYPIIGDHIFGWFGDLVDIVSVVVTMLGVCTSLGLGAGQLNAGLNRINPDIGTADSTKFIIIWIVTGITTLSVASGLNFGIRRLSEVCFSIGSFILLLILITDDTWYLLNVCVQSAGHYMHNILLLGTHTDSFAQQGNAPDGKENTHWMSDWTIFYWGWWISWSPFVGTFIAKISKGRTIREFMFYNVLLTVSYVFVWFCILSGVALQQERDSQIRNTNCTSKCDLQLSSRDIDDMWFDVIGQYGIGSFLSILSFTSMTIYFVTSSDSASLVIDSICANGERNPPVVQRIFWAVTEGACATAMLIADKHWSGSLRAIQAVSIAGSLPYIVVLNFMCLALWRSLKHVASDEIYQKPAFNKAILTIVQSPKNWPKLGLCIVAPWFFLGRAYTRLEKASQKYSVVIMSIIALLFYSGFVLMALEEVQEGLVYVGVAVFLVFGVYCSKIRTEIRHFFHIDGNRVEDFLASLVLYPLVSYQLDHHMAENAPENFINLPTTTTDRRV